MSISQISSTLLNYLDPISSLSPVSSAGSTPSSTALADTFDSSLSGLESAIQAGAVSAAQGALKTFQAATSLHAHRHHHSGSGGFGQDLSGLISSIQSGDLTSAQDYLSDIESHMSQMGSSTSTSGSGMSSTDPLGTFLSSVRAALAQSSLAAAQSALSTFDASAQSSSTLAADLSI